MCLNIATRLLGRKNGLSAGFPLLILLAKPGYESSPDIEGGLFWQGHFM